MFTDPGFSGELLFWRELECCGKLNVWIEPEDDKARNRPTNLTAMTAGENAGGLSDSMQGNPVV